MGTGNINQSGNRVTPRPTAVSSGATEGATRVPADVMGEGKPSRGLLGHLGDVFVGGGQALGDMVKGVFNVITHPIQTVKGLGYVITHPAALVHAFVDPYKQALADGRPGLAIGRGLVEIGSLFVSPSSIGSAFKGAKGILTGSKGAAEAGQVAAKAGTLGAKGAEVASMLGGQAAAATEKAAALAAMGAAGEAAKLNQFARIMQKSATLAATGTDAAVGKAIRYATMASNAAHVNVATQAGTKVMTMAGLVEHSNGLLSAATKVASQAGAKVAGEGAEAATKAASKVATTLPAAADLPVRLTKAASSAVKELGLGAKQAEALLGAADEVFKQARLGGATQTVAIDAAKAFMAEQLGASASEKALSALANTLKPATKNLLNNPMTVAAQFERTNYVTRPMVSAAKAVGRPIDVGIVAAREATEVVGAKVGNAVRAIGELQIRQIPEALGHLVTYPFKVTAQAARGAATAVRNGLIQFGEMPVKRIWQFPAEAVGRAFSGASQFVGRLPNMTIGELIAAPLSGGLLRPAAALSVLGRTGGTTDLPAAEGDVAKKYGILDTAANVRAFKAEVASYAEGAIGPESAPEQVKKLQVLLKKLGYDVPDSGEFDEATALAVIDFKQKNGITQSYQLADGTPAINEYVDEATAKAMVEAAKQGAVDPGKVPAVKAEDVSAKLDALEAAFQAYDGASNATTKARAKTAIEAAAVGAIHDLTAYAIANPTAKADCEAQLDEIGKGLEQRGFAEDAIQALVTKAHDQLRSEMKPAAAATAAEAGPEVPDVSGKQVQASLDALEAAFAAFKAAKTDADKARATRTVETASKAAIHDLTAYGLKNPDAKGDVEDQLNEIAGGLVELGFSEDAVKKLVQDAQASLVAPAAPATTEPTTEPAPVTTTATTRPAATDPKVASYEAHVDGITATLKKIQATQEPAELQKLETELIGHFQGAVADFNELIGKLPDTEVVRYQAQLTQVGTALTQLGFERSQIANILRGMSTRPTEAGGNATVSPAATTPAATTTEPAATRGYTVKKDDTLWRIAKAELGDANRWREIYDLNKAAIGLNPNMIVPGTKLVLPGKEAAAAVAEPAKPVTPTATQPAQPVTPAQPTAPTPAATTEPAAVQPSEAEIKALVAERNILDDPANVKAFIDEVTGYQANGAIGPDAGSPTVVKNLQELLRRLGYKLDASGQFDDATADAVIDFKLKHGLHQSYKLTDGTYAVNEYVGDETARAMVAELQKLAAAK